MREGTDAPETLLETRDGASDDLWLISYADLLTLLLGFFVLIIAGSVARPTRFEQMAASITGSPSTPMNVLKQKVDALVQQARVVDAVITRQEGEGLGIEMKEALLFESGSAQVRSDGERVVAQVAVLLRELPRGNVTVEGHTDDVPVRGGPFASNWELSAQRAINVLHVLETAGVPRDRISIRGFADTRPSVTDGPLDRRRLSNRRVVIRVE